MKRSGNKAMRCIALVTSLLAATGCYEGWEYQKGDRPGDGDEEPQPEPPKNLLYVLFETFRLYGAMDDATCFPNDASKEYRNNEWSERVSSITGSLRSIAETVVVTERDILTDDCATLSGIDAAAVDPNPWSPKPGPGPDPPSLERSTVHLKAVFWDVDVSLTTPSSQVRKVDWAAMSDFISGGEPGVSLTYFILSSEDDAYLQEWREALPEESRRDGTAIVNIDPSPAGLAARARTISNDTSELTQWILEAAAQDF